VENKKRSDRRRVAEQQKRDVDAEERLREVAHLQVLQTEAKLSSNASPRKTLS
jgi:hypothetical protein